MKKWMKTCVSMLLILGLAACGQSGTAQSVVSAPVATETVTVAPVMPGAEEETAGSGIESAAPAPVSAEPASEVEAIVPENVGSKTLVVYYSASGNTEGVANAIAAATEGDLFVLEPVEPYSDDDLNWRDDNSRVVYEHNNTDAREVELVADTVENWDEYDTVFIGYPIWWGIAAWPVDGFVKANDFTGKTVIPFCTSSSSDLGESGTLLRDLAGTGDWLEGERFASSASSDEVAAWVNSLGLE